MTSNLYSPTLTKQLINIILHKIYNENKIETALKKRKLLHDACTKAPFFANGELYRPIDSVATSSPLSPTLANIIMIALEDAIIKDLLNNDIIKFYVRYVDDTLFVAKPSDIDLILKKLNSYHPADIKFTHEEIFIYKNHVHFLDNKLTSDDTTIFRKNTHTGQYISFFV